MGSATGFVVERNGASYLITNFHVVSGRLPGTLTNVDRTGAWPNRLLIMHNAADGLGYWVPAYEDLYDTGGAPLWLEHPTHGHNVDVVALPLTQLTRVSVIPHDPWAAPRAAVSMATGLSVVGFPFGQTGGGGALAIWVRGFVASEPQVDFEGLPRFLIDSRTRPGQSGSPVLNYQEGGAITSPAGGFMVGGGVLEDFLGVYSGRINDQSDLGFVWKAAAVQDVIDGGCRGSVPGPPPP